MFRRVNPELSCALRYRDVNLSPREHQKFVDRNEDRKRSGEFTYTKHYELTMWFKSFPIHWVPKKCSENSPKCETRWISRKPERFSSRYSPEMFSCSLFSLFARIAHQNNEWKMYNNFWLLKSNEIFIKFHLNGRALLSCNSLGRIQLRGE